MIQHYQTEGFVFKKEDSLESDRVFSVFTRDFGRVEVFGKAIRKIDSKLKGGIEIFSLSNIEFIQGRLKKTLTDTVFIKRFKNIFENEVILQTANGICQLADSFIKGQEPDEKIWNLLIDVFEKLNRPQLNTTHCQLMYYYFFWNFVSVLGYTPELSHCANCQNKLNPYALYFSHKEGGVICRDCCFQKKDGTKIKSDIVKVLRLMLKKDWDTLSKLRVESNTQEVLKKISDGYYVYLTNNISNEYKNI